MAKRKTEIEVSLKDGASKGLTQIKKSIGDVTVGIVSLGREAAKVAVGFAALGAAAAAVAAAGLGAGLAKAVGSAADLEQQINRVAAATNAAAEDIPRLFEAAEQGARDTAFNVSETATALETLGREGFNAAQSVEALPAALNLAQAASVGAAEGAGMLTDVLGQFGLGAEQAGLAADVLAAASLKGGTSLQQLFQVLQAAGPAARQAGVSLDDAAAAAALLAQNGIEGGKAGAALTQVFNQLNNAASPFSKALTELGIKSRDFGTVLQELQARGINAQKAFVALGNESSAAIRVLAQNGGANLRELTAELRNSDGAAQALADRINTGFNASLQRLQDTLAGVARAAALPLLDPLADSFNRISARIQAFAESDQFKRILDSIQSFADEAGEALAGFIEGVDFQQVADEIESFLAGASEGIQGLGETIGEFASGVETAFDGVSLVFNGLQTAVLTVAGVVTKAFAAILEAVQLTADGISYLPQQLGIVSESIVDLREEIGGLNAVADEFFTRAAANADETAAAYRDLIGETDEQSRATRDLGAASEEATPKLSGFVEALRLVSPAAAGAVDGVLDAAAAARKAGEDAQGASGGVKQLTGEFEVLAETSKEALAEAAAAALENVRLIQERVSQGLASQQELVDAQLRAQQALTRAGQAGVETQRKAQDELGRTSEKSQKIADDMDRAGRAGANAGNVTAGSFASAAGQIQRAGQATEQLVDSFERAREAGALAGAEIGQLSGAYNRAAASLGNVSDEFSRLAADGLKALIQGGVSGRAQVDRLNASLAQQNREYAEVRDRLDQQIEGYNQLDGAARRVNDQFSFLSEQQRRDLIEKQRQLEQLRQQAEQVFDQPSFTPAPSGGGGGGGGGRATTVNVTINANGVTTRELVDQIKREIEQSLRRAA